MELILLIVPLPLGFLVRSRTAAFVAYIALHSFVFTFQSTSLTLEYIGGSRAAFQGGTPWPYLVVNAIIYAIGLGLVALGAWLRERRTARRTAPVDLAAG